MFIIATRTITALGMKLTVTRRIPVPAPKRDTLASLGAEMDALLAQGEITWPGL